VSRPQSKVNLQSFIIQSKLTGVRGTYVACFEQQAERIEHLNMLGALKSLQGF